MHDLKLVGMLVPVNSELGAGTDWTNEAGRIPVECHAFLSLNTYISESDAVPNVCRFLGLLVFLVQKKLFPSFFHAFFLVVTAKPSNASLVIAV